MFGFTIGQQMLIDEVMPLIRIESKIGNRKLIRICSNVDTTASALLQRKGKHSLRPVARSVGVKVERKRPLACAPQSATRSASRRSGQDHRLCENCHWDRRYVPWDDDLEFYDEE